MTSLLSPLLLILITILSLPLLAASVQALPQVMTFQGVLKNSAGSLLTGTYNMSFRFYPSETGGSQLYYESQNITSTRGVFHAYIGNTTPITLNFTDNYWVSVEVDNDGEMSPRSGNMEGVA